MAIDRSTNFNGTAGTWDTTNFSDFFSASGYGLDGSGAASCNGTNAGAIWDGDTFGNDQYSSISLANLNAANLAGPVVRASGTGASANGYFLGHDSNSNTWYLKKCIDGSWSTLTSGSYTETAGTNFFLAAVGSTLMVMIYDSINFSAVEYTDTSIPSGGYPGFFCEGDINGVFYRWRGGDIPEAGILAGFKNNGWTTGTIGPGGTGGLIHWNATPEMVWRSGTAEQIKFHIESWAGASNVRAAVYDRSDRSLLGVTAETATAGFTAPGICTLDITTPFEITVGQELIICWWCNSGYQNIKGILDESNLMLSGETFSTYPDPLPAYNQSAGSSASEIYIVGTEGGEPPASSVKNLLLMGVG